jgi:hypothetical protein
MSLHLLADGTHEGFDKHRSRFFWEGVGENRKQHWVSWPDVCQPKDHGGPGITNTKIMNIALLFKKTWMIAYFNSLMSCMTEFMYMWL